MNIDKNLAVQWFSTACREDPRISASPYALPFFNYTIPSHINQIGPIIRQMCFASIDDVAMEGARQVTARRIFHGFFEKEFAKCLAGNVPQRKGVANAASLLFHDNRYSKTCVELLRQLMNDPEKEVRDELRKVFRNHDLIDDPEYSAFIKTYISSKSFADNPDSFIRSLKDITGSLIPVAEAVFAVCEEFSTTLKEKSRDMGSIYPHMASEISSVLLRLYEQAQDSRDQRIADRCLNFFDILLENRVGRAIELTKTMEK